MVADEAGQLKLAAMETLCAAARAAGVPFERCQEPREREIDTGEIRLRYLDWGDENGRPVLLLHGSAQTAHSWDFVSLALAVSSSHSGVINTGRTPCNRVRAVISPPCSFA